VDAGGRAGVRKPPKEETAGRKGAIWSGAAYGDFGVADEALVGLRWPVAGMFAAKEKTTGFFVEDPARVGRERGAWRRTAGVLKTAP
jgi:hypothetical protein